MAREKLKPFSIAGLLDKCPECGATGDYALLKARAEAVIDAWNASDGYPDTEAERSSIGKAIESMRNAFNMKRGA